MERRSMKLGVFTVGLPDLTPEEAVRELRDAGYDGVEWRVTRVPEDARSEEPSFWGNNLCTLAPTEGEARRARRISEEAGLEVPGLGTYVAVGDLEATAEAMRFAVMAGAPQVRVGAGALDGRSYEELFAAAREFLEGVEDLARSHGVKALIEIHHRTICPSASLAHRLVSAFDPDLVHRQYRFRTVSYGKSHETTYLRTFVVGKGARAARSRIALQRHFHFAPFPNAPGEFEGG
jgi:sugar phosphate isomerase/epimerase